MQNLFDRIFFYEEGISLDINNVGLVNYYSKRLFIYINYRIQMSGSGKGQIKSKKAKLHQKKQGKQKQNFIPVQLIVSSEDQQDQYHNQSIEKRRNGLTHIKDQIKKYNAFNMQKLKRVQYLPDRHLLNLKPLVVQQTGFENPMQHPQARVTFSYKLEGQQATKYVSDMHLEQRAKKIAEEQLSKAIAQQKEKQAKEKAELDEQKEQKEGEQVEERKRASRYFQSTLANQDEENRLVKCFRCGQKGHIAKNCIEQKLQTKCTFCLGNHHHQDCNSRACFRCNQLGHIAQQCRAIGSECRKCSKKGHIEKACGTIMFLDYSRMKSDSELRQKYGVQDLKKLRCMAGCKDPNGHFNCHKYHQFHKYLPYDTFMRYNDSPQVNSNKVEFYDYEFQGNGEHRPMFPKSKGKHEDYNFNHSNYQYRDYKNHSHSNRNNNHYNNHNNHHNSNHSRNKYSDQSNSNHKGHNNSHRQKHHRNQRW